MRGYLLSFEAILAALLVFLLFTLVFIPQPSTYSVTKYIAANDRIIAKLESCFPRGDCVPNSSECVDYRRVFTSGGELLRVCVPASP